MRDAINIEAIKADIQREKTYQSRFRYASFAVILVVVFGLLYFVNSPQRISAQYDYRAPQVTIASLQAMLTTLTLFVLITALVLAAIQYWLLAHIAARINRYAPSYVMRVTPINILTNLWAYGLFIGIFGVIGISSGVFQAVLLSLSFYGFIISAVVPSAIRFLYQRFIRSAYQGGLSKTEDALRSRPYNLDLLNVKGVLLMEEGNLHEAEVVFRTMLEHKKRWGILNVPLIFNNLGICLMLQSQYDEATDILAAGIHMNPLLGHTYDSLAECYLSQNQQPQLALELIRLALILTNPKLVDSLTIQRATAARALAVTGEAVAAEQLLNEVQQLLAKTKLRAAPATDINRQMGYAYLALGKLDAARNHFLAAIQLDPNGIYGKLAQQGLESIPT